MKRMSSSKLGFALALAFAIAAASASKPAGASQQTDVQLPTTPLKFGAFNARFEPDGTYVLEGNKFTTTQLDENKEWQARVRQRMAELGQQHGFAAAESFKKISL